MVEQRAAGALLAYWDVDAAGHPGAHRQHREDPNLYYPTHYKQLWHLGYMGTFSKDRQSTLNRVMFEPARRFRKARMVVAGPQYPRAIRWPASKRPDRQGERRRRLRNKPWSSSAPATLERTDRHREDPNLYYPTHYKQLWHLGYMGTFSKDRQST